jgi:hypothetical protein
MNFQPGHYLAYEISEKSRAHLLRLFRPQFSKVICHHVTIEFNLTPEKLKNFVTLLDSAPPVFARGIARGDGVECIAITIGKDAVRSDGSFYHITLSVEPPHKPVESNNLQDKVELIRGIVKLEGAFKLLKK